MATIFGYARCSTNESRQDISRQIRELKNLGASEIYCEYESGCKTDRNEFQKIINAIQSGDSLICTEVSRLSRSTRQLCDILQFIQEKHLRLVIGSFVVDCRTADIEAMTKGMLMMWSVFAEMEKDMLSQRVKSGMANACAKGKSIGRPRLGLCNLPYKFLQYYPDYKNGKMNLTDLALITGRSRTTIYKYLELMDEQK